MNGPTIPTLQGTHSVLRALTLADAPSLSRYANDVDVWKNLFGGFPHPYTLADAEGWCSTGSRAAGMGYVWGIEVAGEVVGCMSISPEAGWLHCSAEVGYWIGQPLWRRGITADALTKVTNWAWKALPDLNRIYAPIFASNAGSQAVARKCGFYKEAELRCSAIKDGKVIDRVQFALLRSEN